MISGEKVSLELPVFVDVDFEIDDDGVLRTVVVLDTGDEDGGSQEIYIDFEETVDSIIEFYSGEPHGFFNLFALSNELSRVAHKIHSQACLMDSSGSFHDPVEDALGDEEL